MTNSTRVEVALTGGNIRNNHIYLGSAKSLIPEEAIGGGSAEEAGDPITVILGEDVTSTDVAGDKMIFRSRGAIKSFFEKYGAKEGDTVVLERCVRVTLVKVAR